MHDSEPRSTLQPVRVWDLPTRLFHWTLALAVLGSVLSAKLGGNAMAWHFRLGYLIFTLLAFRLLWGVLGGRWSRFSSFMRGPGTLWRYVRGRSGAAEYLDVGHNPLGALSVLALLGLLAVQVGTGLVADDEIAHQGPLSLLVSSNTVVAATSWHRGWGQWLLIKLVLLHLLAIGWYLLGRRNNLLRPMINGDKQLPAGTPASRDTPALRLLALLLLGLCAGAVTWVIQRGG